MEVLLADVVMTTHMAYLAFLVTGGFLALRLRRVRWPHVIATIWGTTVTVTPPLDCPLTQLEVALRERAGTGAYDGPFIEHYFEGTLYSEGHPILARTIIILVVLTSYLLLMGRILRERSLPAETAEATAEVR
ncbi:MAG: DUF2784 family protein [Propionibacteriales bacterium]|nr:DUF2784 family protein [Propionibacteriales bacterium]